VWDCGQVPVEPCEAPAKVVFRERALGIHGGVKKTACVAEGFAAVFTPGPRAVCDRISTQPKLAPLRGPTRFSPHPDTALTRKQIFPVQTAGIPQTHPSEVEQFMREDAGVFGAIVPQFVL